MENYKLICKSVLLYVTIVVIMLFGIGLDSITEQGYLPFFIFIIAVLLLLCYLYISKKDIEDIQDYFNNLFK